MMQTIINIIIVILGALAIDWTVRRIYALMKRSGFGFHDMIRNPGHWDDVAKSMQERDAAILESKSWDDDKVAAETKKYILNVKSSKYASWEQRILSEMPERTQPTIMGLLQDGSLYFRLVKPTNRDTLPEAPFNRACELLGNSPPAEFVEVLSPFLKDPSDDIRREAIFAIAKTGAATIPPYIRAALEDEEALVLTYALMGLEYALSESRIDYSTKSEMFPDMLRLLRLGRIGDDAAEFLYGLDPGMAMNYFLEEVIEDSKSPILHAVLEAIAKHRGKVPREKLMALIQSLDVEKLEYPQTYALGETLHLLGQHKQPEDLDLLRPYLKHEEGKVAAGASNGLLYFYGVEDYYDKVWDIYKRLGPGSLNEHQRLYVGVFMGDAEICNGGLAQFFVNSTGDNWADTVAGYLAMGMTERHAIVHKAAQIFGLSGPSIKTIIRRNQLSKLFSSKSKSLADLDSKYYQSEENVYVHCVEWVLSHPESFR